MTQRIDRFAERVRAGGEGNQWNSPEKMGSGHQCLQSLTSVWTFVAQSDITQPVPVAESFEVRLLKKERKMSRGGGFPFVARENPGTIRSQNIEIAEFAEI